MFSLPPKRDFSLSPASAETFFFSLARKRILKQIKIEEKDVFYCSNRVHNQNSQYRVQGRGNFCMNRQNFHKSRDKNFTRKQVQ